MALTIKTIQKGFDTAQVQIDIINDHGDVAVLTCFSTEFRDRLLTQLSGALENFTISYKKGD